jgi:hypothetical protein
MAHRKPAASAGEMKPGEYFRAGGLASWIRKSTINSWIYGCREVAMMELRLTVEEGRLLLDLLQEHQTHLLREIAKADHHEFRTGLRKRCTVLEEILAKVQSPVQSAA